MYNRIEDFTVYVCLPLVGGKTTNHNQNSFDPTNEYIISKNTSGAEEFQRAGTAKMHKEAVYSGLLPPLSVHLRKDLAHMIKKWPVSFDLL